MNASRDGIEKIYTTFDEKTTKRFYQIAKDKNLIITACSDFDKPGTKLTPELACWKDYGLEFTLDKRLFE